MIPNMILEVGMSKPKLDLEALKALKDKRKLSNQNISNLADVPLSTVNRIFRGESEPNVNTLAVIVYALGSSLDEVCGFSKKCEEADSETGYKLVIKHLEKNIEEKGRWIKVLAVALGVVLLVFLAVVAYDVTNGSIGWARYTEAYRSGDGMEAILSTISDWFGL